MTRSLPQDYRNDSSFSILLASSSSHQVGDPSAKDHYHRYRNDNNGTGTVPRITVLHRTLAPVWRVIERDW